MANEECQHIYEVNAEVAFSASPLKGSVRIASVKCKICGMVFGFNSPESPASEAILPLYAMNYSPAAPIQAKQVEAELLPHHIPFRPVFMGEQRSTSRPSMFGGGCNGQGQG